MDTEILLQAATQLLDARLKSRQSPVCSTVVHMLSVVDNVLREEGGWGAPPGAGGYSCWGWALIRAIGIAHACKIQVRIGPVDLRRST